MLVRSMARTPSSIAHSGAALLCCKSDGSEVPKNDTFDTLGASLAAVTIAQARDTMKLNNGARSPPDSGKFPDCEAPDLDIISILFLGRIYRPTVALNLHVATCYIRVLHCSLFRTLRGRFLQCSTDSL